MNERATILGVLAPVIARYEPPEQRIFAALGERIAAARYRVWAKATGDDAIRATLEACADREEDIASRVESLRPDAREVQERLQRDHGDIRDQYFELLDGRPLVEQFAMQAEAERAGAAAWRAFADAAENEHDAEILRACAPLEEESAEALERIIASMTRSA